MVAKVDSNGRKATAMHKVASSGRKAIAADRVSGQVPPAVEINAPLASVLRNPPMLRRPAELRSPRPVDLPA